MDAEAVQSMLRDDHAEWEALVAVLEANPDGPLHGPESPDWTARDVYAHLARWVETSTAAMESWLSSRTIPTPPEGNDDEINARWRQEDSGLSLAEARARAQHAFERRVAVIQSIPEDRWDALLEATAHADDARHYRSHREYIVA